MLSESQLVKSELKVTLWMESNKIETFCINFKFMKNKILIFISLFALINCSGQIPDENKDNEAKIKLGAYYYGGWSGTCPYDDGKPEHAWAKGMPLMVTRLMTTEFAGCEPVWGWREDTQEIMEQQIDLAANSGIAYFSFCWYWRDNKGPINVPAIKTKSEHLPMYLFMSAKNNTKMEFCLLVANHSGAEITGTEAWKQAADFWIKNYFKHPRYLKSEGKPVIMIFDPKGADKDGLAYLQEAAKEADYPGVFVAGCGNCSVENGFQVQTLYNTKPKAGLNLTDIYPFHLLSDWNISVWDKINLPMAYIPCLTSGWDRRPWEASPPDGRGSAVSAHFQRGPPGELEQYMKSLVDWKDAHPCQITKDRLAIIYAWNEIGEGAWILPCKDDPEGAYLKAIRKVVFGK
ncbi:MAG: hypothetical protein A2W90_17830 [Bacteroidetes bacterium GWF2_42_66]|nr:MAG: hypothetical protein A2W92_13100 [Bacteroidetes bacterium GWA2_42_15]OFX98114.1 MAG: hypothetical protein A2W89_09320 [Bacteroidetes bacterium GWE2_42_39]OFY42498.1 MAG: hypothetical protein A2W90_17830 [Bacteroidetes bacterium GWF2_42_66]HAZ03787.1 hypothetical protein [Marinilabiliales bacterium]HBL74213.1 hypothetical protein [Prolixibacteraceae bacterium]